jgi:CAAX protease family protein
MSTRPDAAAHSEDWREPERPDANEPPPADGSREPMEEADARLAASGAPESESYFQSYAPSIPPMRFPNMMDVVLMGILFAFGWLASGGMAAAALHFHLFGVTTEKQAVNDIHYTLGSQGVWYLISLGLALILFPRVWQTGFFEGIEWRAAAALRLRWQLFSAAFACFALAIIDGVLMPGPKEAPIDQVFRIPGAAWLLFLFGVTLAPFFEEMAFRGFLLPALCTAWDWGMERVQHRAPRWPDEEGKTQWSLTAMVVGSLLTSIPFALMHGEQTGYSLGPFLLLVCVSLALCWVRLSTRSVAASAVVHACYNLLLFSLMIWGTGGFKNLDKM